MKRKYYAIANADNTEFIGADDTSGGYPYVTNMFQFCYIDEYERVSGYFKDMTPYIENVNNFSIKRVVLEDISTD